MRGQFLTSRSEEDVSLPLLVAPCALAVLLATSGVSCSSPPCTPSVSVHCWRLGISLARSALHPRKSASTPDNLEPSVRPRCHASLHCAPCLDRATADARSVPRRFWGR
jgi:hypothetical protein